MASILQFIPLISLVLGIALMLLLNIRFKFNAVIALLLAAILVAVLNGMDLGKLVTTIQNGVGSTLGSLLLIVGLGAVLGRLMIDCGAAQRLATTLVDRFGSRFVIWAILIVGLIFGISVFFEVGFIILAPLIITVAKEAKIPHVRLGVAMIAALSVAHSLFPPQAGPVALVSAYQADMGRVYIYGAVVAVPTIIVAGVLFPRLFKWEKVETELPELVQARKVFSDDEMPGFSTSLIVPLLPAIIVMCGTIVNAFVSKESLVHGLTTFFGSAVMAMLVSVLVALYFFGTRVGRSISDTMSSFSSGIADIGMIIFIIAAGGVFKQVIIDTGVGNWIASSMQSYHVSPLLMGWGVAVLIRLATGQGVVSAVTAAGIVAPMIGSADPVLMVLSTAIGANTLTHINDASFWLFKEYFGLSVKDTFKSWSVTLLVTSIVGLGVVLLLSLFVG